MPALPTRSIAPAIAPAIGPAIASSTAPASTTRPLGWTPSGLRSPANGGAPAGHVGGARRSPLTALRADPRQAVEQDLIRCLVCGSAFRQLTNTHLRAHGMSAEVYKRQFGYNRGRPLMCLALQRLYTERAVKIGLASRIRQRPILVRPELRRRGGARTIALEEVLTRREVRGRARVTTT